jgi:hypothetical protein
MYKCITHIYKCIYKVRDSPIGLITLVYVKLSATEANNKHTNTSSAWVQACPAQARARLMGPGLAWARATKQSDKELIG